MKQRTYYVYIRASRSLNLYTGVTSSIYRRALQHKRGEIEGFTQRYKGQSVGVLPDISSDWKRDPREKQIKSWTRAKRLALIRSKNATWQDLAEGWGQKAELHALL